MIGFASALCATHVVARSTKRSLVPVPGWWYSSPTPSGQTAVASQKHPARKGKLCQVQVFVAGFLHRIGL